MFTKTVILMNTDLCLFFDNNGGFTLKKKKLFTVLAIISFSVSVIFLLYPFASNCINQFFNRSKVADYNKTVSTMSESEIDELFAAAIDYNKRLAERVTSDEELFSYEHTTGEYLNILNFDDGQIGNIEIPTINVNLPIYHGTSEKVLEKGAAHLPDTSLPIYGESVHSVISAHTAFPGKVFFDDLEKLETGDYFYVTVLNKKLKYEICRRDIVEPEDTRLLQIQNDDNYVTLMTCYPYAVNSHRLLLRGRLIDTEDINLSVAAEQSDEQSFDLTPIITATVFITLLIAACVVGYIIMKRKKAK